MVIFPDFSAPSRATHRVSLVKRCGCGETSCGPHRRSPRRGPYCHNEEHLTDPTSAERPPKGVRSGYRKSVNQVRWKELGERQTKVGRFSKLEEGKLFFLKIGSFKMLKRLLMEKLGWWDGGMASIHFCSC